MDAKVRIIMEKLATNPTFSHCQGVILLIFLKIK